MTLCSGKDDVVSKNQKYLVLWNLRESQTVENRSVAYADTWYSPLISPCSSLW